MKQVHRVVGGALILLSIAPLYRLLDAERTGTPGSVTLGIAEGTMGFVWLGTVLVAIVGLAGGMLAPAPAAIATGRRLRGWMLAPSPAAFSALAAALAAVLTALFTLVVLDGLPNHGDAIAQLLHARYVAAGELAGPVSPLHHFWHIPNTVATEAGWVSQYPPAHTLLLAVGVALGALWLVPALLVAATVFLTGLTAHRLFPDEPMVARIGTLLLALSLFFIGLAGAYMNHVTAAAFIALALYAALRAASEDGIAWALVTGCALALCFATRPLAALVAGALTLIAYGRARGDIAGVRFVAQATLGAAPVLALLMAYNARFFGGPLRMGYAAGTGESTGLGFGVDPWGNSYGPLEALAYTSADLSTLNLFLNEWPFPVVAVAGAFLLLRRRLDRGESFVACWALLPVVANALYWHHGQFMGPRMLAEFAPAWTLMLACALVGLYRMLPQAPAASSGFAPRRALVVATCAAALAGFAYLAPLRADLYADVYYPGTRLDLPDVDAPALVFVHEPVGARVNARLAAHGMPVDSIERAMGAASICDMLEFSRGYADGAGDASPPQPPAAGLERLEIVPGLTVKVPRDGRIADACARELRADRAGTVDLFTRLWRGDLPGIEDGAEPMFVRDFGPADNRSVIERFPDRVPFVLTRTGPDEEPRLLSYDEGMRVWSR